MFSKIKSALFGATQEEIAVAAAKKEDEFNRMLLSSSVIDDKELFLKSKVETRSKKIVLVNIDGENFIFIQNEAILRNPPHKQYDDEETMLEVVRYFKTTTSVLDKDTLNEIKEYRDSLYFKKTAEEKLAARIKKEKEAALLKEVSRKILIKIEDTPGDARADNNMYNNEEVFIQTLGNGDQFICHSTKRNYNMSCENPGSDGKLNDYDYSLCSEIERITTKVLCNTEMKFSSSVYRKTMYNNYPSYRELIIAKSGNRYLMVKPDENGQSIDELLKEFNKSIFQEDAINKKAIEEEKNQKLLLIARKRTVARSRKKHSVKTIVIPAREKRSFTFGKVKVA